MTFNAANFAPVGNTSKPVSGVGTATIKGAPTVYSYVTADLKNTVTAADYFLGMVNVLNKGDLIYAVTGAGSGGTLAAALLVVNAVTRVAAGTPAIDVVDGTAITMTDTY